jgi:tetratricopeptide (TPR) repeat protein
MEAEAQCPRCGRKIPWGQKDCPFCASHGWYSWSQRRDTFLLMIIVLLVLMFAITSFTVRNYFEDEKAFAEEWYTRGEQDLQAKRLVAALADFRTALSYSHNNPQYQLRLAQALARAEDSEEARAEARTYLLSLLEREPGNGVVNLELARLATRGGDVSDALRYYHGAIYGAWTDHQVAKRRAARLELVQFLLDVGQKEAARAELIAMAPDLPADPVLQTRVGNLLLRVQGYDDALKLFQRALLEDPRLPAALAGAGECHFQEGNYARAERYLTKAVQQDPSLVDAARMRDTARAILNLDPFGRHLSNLERARRAAMDFKTAGARLASCAGEKGIDLKASGGNRMQILSAEANELQPRAQQRYVSRDPELLSHVMDVVFEIEQTTAHACGQPHGQDFSLLLIAQEQGGSHP